MRIKEELMKKSTAKSNEAEKLAVRYGTIKDQATAEQALKEYLELLEKQGDKTSVMRVKTTLRVVNPNTVMQVLWNGALARADMRTVK